MEEKKKRIEELVKQLNQASEQYYGGKDEGMSNYEWDALFDELATLEQETGYILPESPTQTTSTAQEEGKGEKEAHEYPALSLAKTKKIEDLQEWAGDKKVWVSWKLDGLTLVLTYDDGSLTRILTRGNGTVGTNITYMAPALKGVPQKISYKGHLVVRGEATISYQDFEAINDTLDDEDEKYANPRNLAAGTLGLDKTNLDKVAQRNVTLNAFTLVYLEEEILSWGERMNWLDKQGFITVERQEAWADTLPQVIEAWTKRVEEGKMDLPVDGLVLSYDDTAYAASGTVTGHHATRGGLAFKWQDVSAITWLDHVEWSCAASAITPVAVFQPVQLEGTTVSRASLCNISELERLGIGEDGKTLLEVIKANKIIPKCIAVKEAQGTFTIPESCPVCQAPTRISVSASGTKVLRCTNPECPAKHLKRFTRFVSKEGLEIDGLSIQTLLAFINKGFIHRYQDIFHLSQYADQIREMEGFGQKSCDNLLAAIEKSRKTTPVKFIYSLCIPLIGVDAGKKLVARLGTQGLLDRMRSGEGFEDVDGIGPEKSGAIVQWCGQEENKRDFEALLQELEIEQLQPQEKAQGSCQGLTFVITGDVHHYKNRAQLKEYIESQGGTVTGSVSKKTSYLINNDVTSQSGKNKKAQELGIPILSEDDFVAQFG